MNAVFGCVRAVLLRGDTVQIAHFGTFLVSTRVAGASPGGLRWAVRRSPAPASPAGHAGWPFPGALRGSSRDRASVVCRPGMSVIALRDVWPFGASRAPWYPAAVLPCAPPRMVSRGQVLPSAR